MDDKTRIRNDRLAPSADDRYGALIEAAPDAILEVDHDGRIVLANQEAENLFRCGRDEIIGKGIEAFIPDRFRIGHVAHRSHYTAQPTKRPMGSGLDLWAQRSDGTEVPVDIKLSPVQTADGLRTLCVVRDVTEHRSTVEEIRRLNQMLEQRNRDVERANQLKSEFLASMSHELRTPLNAIIGFSDLLQEESAGALNPKQRRYTDHIGQGARHLLALINDILDLSKIEAGRIDLHMEPLLTKDVVAEVLTSIRAAADQKRLRLRVEVPPDLEIVTDPVRFKQILLNILTNATKFTPAGGMVTVKVEGSGDLCRICISDTGIGIAAENLESIFDSFRQVAATTKGVREGTGLGLAITKRLVELHRGRIWVESEVGKGSSFFIELPLRRGPRPVPLVAGSERTVPLVLVVEDEEPARELLCHYLESEGYETAWAATGGDALVQAARLRPQAITLDLLLPDGNGLKTLHQLKTIPDTSSIPVIVVSVLDETDVGIALGASEYLIKPVEKEKLLTALRKHIPVRSTAAARILVVDDVTETRYLLAAVLDEHGYVSLLAASGAEAFEILGRIRPDAVLLDLLMPEMDGFEVLARIREDRSLRNLPVFVLTAKDLTRQDLARLGGRVRAVFQKGDSWKRALLDQLQLAVGGNERP